MYPLYGPSSAFGRPVFGSQPGAGQAQIIAVGRGCWAEENCVLLCTVPRPKLSLKLGVGKSVRFALPLIPFFQL